MTLIQIDFNVIHSYIQKINKLLKITNKSLQGNYFNYHFLKRIKAIMKKNIKALGKEIFLNLTQFNKKLLFYGLKIMEMQIIIIYQIV